MGWHFLLNPPPAAAHGPAPSGPSTVTWSSKTSISVDQLWGVSGEVPANVPVRVFPFQKYTRGGMHEGKERAGKEKVRAFSGKRRGAYFTGEGRKEGSNAYYTKQRLCELKGLNSGWVHTRTYTDTQSYAREYTQHKSMP